jgi:S-adenosylmethionine decarboxylase
VAVLANKLLSGLTSVGGKVEIASVPSIIVNGELGTANALPADGAHFGEHFMIDGYKGSRDRLSDRRVVQRCLDELPEKLGMRKLAEPTVLWVEPNGIRDPGGWSGFVVIAESHLSIHTFPGRLYASIDVYTCRNGLATADIEAYFREVFGFAELETNFVQRGKKYPLRDC